MSWSTRITSAPVCSGMRRMTCPRCSVSSSGRPAAGSSSRTRRGLPTTARATSTRRRSRAPSVPTVASGSTSPRPTKSSAASTSSRREARLPRRECSWASATFAATDSSSIACSVWNVRRSPQRARRKCGIARRSSPNGRGSRPDAGATKPLRTLKNVVLPAPFGPIRPQVPASKRTVMPSSGVTPPKRTVRSSISISARAPRPAGRARVAPEISPHSRARSFGIWAAEPGRRGQQHLQHADAEQDREQVGGQVAGCRARPGRSFMNMPATTAPQRL